LGKHGRRAFAIRPPDQRLLSDDPALTQIDNRLKRHGKWKV
jgi:hypothetical protein